MLLEVIDAAGRKRTLDGPAVTKRLRGGDLLTRKSKRHLRRAIRAAENNLGLRHQPAKKTIRDLCDMRLNTALPRGI